MRGSLICNPNGTVDFVIDEGGHFEMMMSDRNKIIPYHKSAVDDFVVGIDPYDYRNNTQAKQKEHICKYCGEITCTDDEMCYKNPKNNPQAKQESNTPDYVITSIRNKERKEIWKLGVGRYIHENYLGVIFPDDEVLKKDFEIWSVKRLSDNSEFTVGDETEQGKIESLLLSFASKMCARIGKYDWYLNELQKKKETVMIDMDAPLFSITDIISYAIPITLKKDNDDLYLSKKQLIELAQQKIKQ